jgi:hypothetical protein
LDAVLTIITLNKPFPFTMVALGGRCTIWTHLVNYNK